MLMAVLLYLDRFCVGFAQPYIRQDLNLSEFQMGLFFSAFFLPYALAQVPSGFLSDRYGARIMLTIYIIAWSVFTALMGLAGGFAMLILMRAATGLGQSGAYPTSSSIISKWVPFAGRGGASSVIAFGGRLGGAIAPLLTAILIVAFVPVSQPSTLTPGEILDLPALCNELQGGAEDIAPDVEHVRSQMSPESIERVDELALKYKPDVERRKKLLGEVKKLQDRWMMVAAFNKTEEADAVEFHVEDTDRKLIADQLNGMIGSTDFYSKDAFAKLARLDNAAIKFMKRANAGESLSETEWPRFNRLLFEGVFPNSIGKVYVGGWRPVMITYGLAGFGIAAVFWIFVRNRPTEHNGCNEAERALIDARPPGATSPHGKPESVPWANMLRSRSLWLSSMAQVGTNIGWVFIVTWFPTYLLKAHQVPILERGIMASIPLFVGWAGMLGGGRLTDVLARKIGVKWGRRLPWSLTRFVAMSAFLSCLVMDDPWSVTMAMAVVAFSTDLGTPSAWAFTQDVGGKHVGSVLGWGNMWGNLGATISPILIAWAMSTQDWNTMFQLCAAAFAFAGIMALGIDASKPVVPDDD